MLHSATKRRFTRAWPICAWVGPNGGGKSAGMVWSTLPTLDAGRPVLSTVRLLDFRNPRECEGCPDSAYHQEGEDAPRHRQAHPAYVPFTDWEQLIDAKDCDVLMDEVTGVASSRESAGLPAPVANKLVQLRRDDVCVRWTSPAWARADKIIRETTQAVVFCQGYLPKIAAGGDRMWRQRRLFVWKTYDAVAFEDFTAGKRESLGAEQSEFHWGPSSPAFLAYDTYDQVSVIGTVSDSGRCYRCGGRRAIPSCGCPDNAGAKRAHQPKAGGEAPAVAGDLSRGRRLLTVTEDSPAAPARGPLPIGGRVLPGSGVLGR